MNNRSAIHESLDIRDVMKQITPTSWVLFDFDNTIMEPNDESCGVGSDQWFTQLIQYASSLILDSEEALIAVLAIYDEVLAHVQMQVVEQNTVEVIRALQNQHIMVIGITTRGERLRELTLNQLASVGVKPDQAIFCNGRNKGECFVEFCQNIQKKPPHFVMVDDKLKYNMQLSDAAKVLGASFDGIRYGFLDEKIKKINMDIANNKLIEMKDKFTSSTQQIMDKLNITKPEVQNKEAIKSEHASNRNNLPVAQASSMQSVFTTRVNDDSVLDDKIDEFNVHSVKPH